MDLLSLKDLTEKEINDLINKAIEIKKNKKKYFNKLKNKTLTLLFQKPSTRTRIAFEAGMTQLGGHAIYTDWQQTQLAKAKLSDEIKCILRYSYIIAARVNNHEDIEIIADASDIPVINVLSDLYHPCQAIADLITIKEKRGNFDNVKIAYIGDGNNVCNSLIIACSKVGVKINVAAPKGYEPYKEAVEIGKKHGKLKLTNNPKQAIKNTDFIYTDTWISMGQEKEKEKKLNDFKGYQINKELLKENKKALIMHCLPAIRNQEITGEILDGKNSIVFDQAENKLHAQKAILLKSMGVI